MTRTNHRKNSLFATSALARYIGFALGIVTPLASVPVHAQTLPSGGSVAAGSGTVTTTANSLTVPTTQLASLRAPQEVADERPVSRASSAQRSSAFLPNETPTTPVVPVYPRKQARH